MAETQDDPHGDGQPDADSQRRGALERRIVIAGGSGFIGRRLSAVLAARNYEVVVLSRAPRAPVGPVRFVHWQPSQDGSETNLLEFIDGSAAVVNLAGESIGGPRWSAARKSVLIQSRVVPSQTLVAAINACEAPPAVLLQASGVGYYGPGNDPVTERSAAGDDFLAELAVRWEAPLTELRADVRPVIARLGVVLGRTGGALAQMLIPFRLFVGGPIAGGKQWLSWIHLHDVAAAMTTLIESPDSQGPYNLCAPNPVRNSEFARIAGAALHRPAWMFTPKFLLKLMLGEQATLICEGQQALPERLEAAGFRFQQPDLASAFEELTSTL